MERGVTSVTLDKNRGQATVFGSSTIDIDDLVKVVRAKGFTCDTWANKRKANPLASAPGYLDEQGNAAVGAGTCPVVATIVYGRLTCCVFVCSWWRLPGSRGALSCPADFTVLLLRLAAVSSIHQLR